ncbi:hypothetical protein Acy02nite_85160 [Actinoplanes cyaneus]|uniref:Uncharacterized protein n=1 Tax=Actinoplanes cyaneus TaxID=52696 RepID=A0A919IR12_9ACTN|nr:hypothetical protein Acy02nite_85160 [Actinoplanes cyaneus]
MDGMLPRWRAVGSDALWAGAAALVVALVGVTTNIATSNPDRVRVTAAGTAIAVFIALEIFRARATLHREPAANPPLPIPADMTAVVVARPDDSGAGQLFTANWEPMLGDEVAFEVSGAIESVQVDVALLSDWLAAEENRLTSADMPDVVRNQDLRLVRKARARAEKLGPEMVKLACATHAARYTDAEIRTILDRSLSFRVNNLLARTGHPNLPHPQDLDEMAAFTLGYAKEDLIELGFDAGPAHGGHQAYVPRAILLDSPLLMGIGELLAPADSSPSTTLYVACQFAHDFNFVSDQRLLWTHFVLPQAFVRYPFEGLVIDVSLVRRFGLP